MATNESGQRVVEATGIASLASAGTAKISVAANASIIYVNSSRMFSARAELLDSLTSFDAANPEQRTIIETELQSLSLAAVMTAYFAVEALLNEVFLAHTLGMLTNFPGLDRGVAARLSAAWEAGARKLSPLEKADLALVISAAKPLHWGEPPALPFARLHDLRNDLVHHKPQWVEHGNTGANSDDKRERQLHQQFAVARIWRSRGVSYRWNGCLGGPCATWAHTTAVKFSTEFCTRLGIQLVWLKV